MQAIVFGGTRGVGRQIVDALYHRQIPVIFTGTDHFKTKQIEKEFNNQKALRGMALKMEEPEKFPRFVENVYKSGFQPNILIFNAGYLSLRAHEKDQNLQKLFQINTLAPIMLTEHFLPQMQKKNYGHLVYTSPTYKIDDKVRYLTPYMQSKLAQTTYMKSMARVLRYHNISCNSVWTKYPLWTDALRLRNIGSREECVDPRIMVHVIEEILFHENPLTFKGNELIDDSYLRTKGVDTSNYFLGTKTRDLDEVFLSHLKSPKSANEGPKFVF